MTRTLLATLVASLVLAAPAHAGGGGTPPAPAPATDPCEGLWDYGLVNASNGGCLGVAVSATGVFSVGFVVPLPGWTYKVESAGGGSNNRVQVEFTHTASGARALIRVEPGKTLIR